MIAAYKTVDAFRGYLTVLGELERMFQFAGEKIEFRLKVFAGKDLCVEILREGKAASAAFIGGSPAQALKDVARAVIL